MGRKSYSVDLLNDFVIDNLIPYAWADHYWRTEADRHNGMFYFCMLLEPNQYEHTLTDEFRGISHPSSNTILTSYVLPDPSYFRTYGICIAMWNGSAITNSGVPIDCDKSGKFNYKKHLAKSVLTSLEMMGDLVTPKVTCVDEVFGSVNTATQNNGWKKVISYSTDIDKVKRDEWSFI